MLLDRSTPSPTLPLRVLPGMPSLLVALVLLVGAVGPFPVLAEGGDEDVDFERRIVWSEDGDEGLFIPAALFDEVPLEDLPLDRISMSSLRWELDFHTTEPQGPLPPFWKGERPECLSRGHSAIGVQGDPAAPDARSWSDLVLNSRVAFVGTVRAVVHGWSSRHQSQARATYVRVDRLVQDVDDALSAGETFVFVLDGGWFTVEDVRLCTTISTQMYQPESGDSILFLGGAFDHGYLLDATRFFEIKNETIRYRPTRALQEKRDKPLAELLDELVTTGGTSASGFAAALTGAEAAFILL